MLKPVFVDGAWSWRLVGVISEAIQRSRFRARHRHPGPFHIASGSTFPRERAAIGLVRVPSESTDFEEWAE